MGLPRRKARSGRCHDTDQPSAALIADRHNRGLLDETLVIWGGGVSYGETDEFSYNVARDPVHVHDLHATLLHCLGIDHTKLTYKFQGRHYRLTDVHGNVIKDILS